MSDNQEKTPSDFSSLTENLSQQQVSTLYFKYTVRDGEKKYVYGSKFDLVYSFRRKYQR